MGDSVPRHTGPISLTDTHLEPSVSKIPTDHHQEITTDGKASYQRRSSGLPMQLFGVETDSFLPNRSRVIAAIFLARVRRAIVGRIPFQAAPHRNRTTAQGEYSQIEQRP